MKITPRCAFAVLLPATIIIGSGCSSEQPPEKLSAAHVLIMYDGSERAPAEISRTKEEALALATEIATKAKAEGADSPRWRQSIRTAPVAPRVATWAILGHVI